MQTKFKQKHAAELSALLEVYTRQLREEVIPFWQKRVLDDEHGGYYTCFDKTGKLYDDRKPGWFAGRTLHTFSSLYNDLEQNPAWLEMADAGRRYYNTAFYAGDGRFNQMMSREGRPLVGTISIFTDHFAAKGLGEYIAARPQQNAADAALYTQLCDTLFANTADPEILAAEGTPRHLQKHAVNFMNLLVAQESRKVVGDRYAAVLESSLQRSLYTFANSAHAAPLEYVGLDGAPVFEGRGRLIDPGHTMESLWFAMQEGKKANRPELIHRAGEVADWVIQRAYDEEYGGFYQHVDVENTTPEAPYLTNAYGDIDVAWNDKIWWTQAECMLALAMSALYSQNERHYGYFIKMHEYTNTLLRDKEYGEWYSFLKRDGSMLCSHKGSFSKGFYHVPRCLLQLILLLREYLA